MFALAAGGGSGGKRGRFGDTVTGGRGRHGEERGWGGRREQAMVGKEKKKTVVTTGFHGFSIAFVEEE